jgi:type II secretory pathway predicted ATPase ExeA/UDP-N-acetylglucosamine 2-epimerase
MYEQYFGITGPPFQLTPDPYFFFESEQHSAALTALRSAFTQERPFVVLSGEIGAGKTTVLRTWLAEAEAGGIVVGQAANTQLDADDMLRLVAHAFGADATAEGPAQTQLQSFFGSLGKRPALLIIDEAQNLGHEALRRLIAVAEMAVRERAMLRICLAGQPGLRALLGDPALQGLAARVQQSCHLGALVPAQTAAYVEHRLRKVGWAGRPAFDAEAFEAIHRESGGVPRRINALCHRLMLAQYLDGRARIDAQAVLATARELDDELGTGLKLSVPAATDAVPPTADTQVPVPSVPESPESPGRARPDCRGAVLLLASGRSDHIKAVPLLRALVANADLPPAVLVSLEARGTRWLDADRGGSRDAGRADGPDIGASIASRHLVLGGEAGHSTIESRFARLIEECAPRAVVVFDGDAQAQRCVAVAHELEVPVVHVGTDSQGDDESALPRSAIASVARLRFACQSRSSDRSSIQVGNLLVDAIQLAEQRSSRAAMTPELREVLDDARGYALAWLKELPAGRGQPWHDERVELLREVALDLPVVWPMAPPATPLVPQGGAARGPADGIVRIDELDHAGFIALMADATCVLTDSLDVIEEAAVLAVPCLSLGPRHASEREFGGWLPAVPVGRSAARAARAVRDAMFNLWPAVTSPANWDGRTASRIATCFAAWLAETARHAG